MKEEERELERTRRYAQGYGVVLTKEEMKERWISDKIRREARLERILVNWKTGENEEQVREAEVRKQVARKIAKAMGEKVREIIFLGITGSVAAGYPKKNDDIDFMVVTEKDSLWIARWKWYRWISKTMIKRRRRNQREKKNEVCFNLWLEEDSMGVPKEKRNLQNAMDVIMMKPVWDKYGIYGDFLRVNSWVKKYVATGYQNKVNKQRVMRRERKREEPKLLIKLLNLIAYGGQKAYMKPKMTTELVNMKRAFFHPDKKCV